MSTVKADYLVNAAGTGAPTLTNGAVLPAGSAAAPAIAPTGDSNTGLFFPAADTVAVATGGTERMRVNSSGNVGIGTSSPATQLDLAANNTAGTALNVLRFTDTDLSATAPQELGKIEFYSADNSAPGAGVKASITGIAEVGNPGGGIAFSTDLLTGTPIERMRIDRFGNVGIGTTTPTSLGTGITTLELKGNSASQTDRAGGINFMRYDGNPGMYVYHADDASYIASLSTYPLLFQTNGTERMRIDSSGNLLFNSGYGSAATAYGCRAWVKFNGTGTVAINGSGNVSSISDNGTGLYTVNFTTAMPDANFAAVGAVANVGSTAATQQRPSVFDYLTTSVSLSSTQGSTASLSDTDEASVAVFR